MLNPELDTRDLAERFSIDERIRVHNVLRADVAERIRQTLLEEVSFSYITNIDGRNVEIPQQDFRSLSQSQLDEIREKTAAAAASGIGFIYEGYRITRQLEPACSENIEFLHSMFDYLNSRTMLDFVQDVTGANDLKSADAQYTRYDAGSYLTRHRDVVEDEQRRFAYVISFNRDWHPDWGGLLQFFEDDGTPRDAWSPRYNAMSLFDVRHVHSVTYVPPFTPKPRLSLTGWFRSRPNSL